ncbi:MAG: family 1 glycosylhydrolase [Candidatus Omnitrophota bacterium]
MQTNFPQSFLWGAALSSYQAEGGNFNSDWFLWEKTRNITPCGKACGHYERFESDFDIAHSLGLNALRVSFEWARLCPSPDAFDEEVLEHYQRVICALAARGLTPLVNLHHFTNPVWFAERGGWLNAANIDSFLCYTKRIAQVFKEHVAYWLVFNEPFVYAYNGFVRGIWPPGARSYAQARRVIENIASAYISAYQEIKAIYGARISHVSFSKHMRFFAPCPVFSLGLSSLAARVRDAIFNIQFIERLATRGVLDFIAVNYYCKEYVHFGFPAGRECAHQFHRERKNHIGWWMYPEGLYALLLRLRRFRLPVIVTENGSAETDNDAYRDYMQAHIEAVARALRAGVDVRGYLWWALLDNFEWDKGFEYRFGLIHVDYAAMTRTVRPFALDFAGIAKENRVTW